ncbi:phosphotransferase [Candidatus Dojkabacteria bacterium]|nr:phosphotransferase [Candidatus Dojkabacteria bacterium]
MPLSKDSTITSYEIIRLKYGGLSSLPQTYLLKLEIKGVDGSCESKKIVLKHLNPNDLINNSTLELKDFSRVQSIKVPRTIYADFDLGYIFREFKPGKEVAHLLDQILYQGYIKNWQKKVFKRIGQGLAEIHTKLNIIHCDPLLFNWIYDAEKDELSLIDWEWLGEGDPAWDLSRIIYDVGRHVSRQKYRSGSKRINELYHIFNAVYLEVINGYAEISKNKEIIRKSANYWMHYSFSVTAEIHEIIFRSCDLPLPRGFTFLRRLPDSIFSKMLKEDSSFFRRLFRIFTKLSSLVLLVSSKRGRKDVSRTFKRLTKMFKREIRNT